MRSKIALRLAALALGAAFASAPAVAQKYVASPQSPGVGYGPSGYNSYARVTHKRVRVSRQRAAPRAPTAQAAPAAGSVTDTARLPKQPMGRP
jgi:hypothetical protein